MRKIFYTAFIALGISESATGQIGSITPVLIGSTGNFSVNGNLMLSSSTGECIVPTVANGGYILTQGFQQPSGSGVLALTATLTFANASCAGSNDGVAEAFPIGGTPPYSYLWSTPQNDTLSRVDSLPPGTYVVTITDAGNLSLTDTIVINDGTGICGLHVYSGLTPNGDGHNDTWIIDYIEVFKPNTVQIYNRWGQLVWEGADYDNQSVVWTGNNMNSQPLPDGTYYYIITVGLSTMKGWVELSH